MDSKERFSVLFDFDGVVMDTESQYSVFWHQIGVDYLQNNNLEQTIKGQTLTTIFSTYFKEMPDQWDTIDKELKYFEQHMKYEYIDGFLEFMQDLKRHGAMTAVVTSSDEGKMAAVYAAHPEIPSLFDRIFTAEVFSKSKPDPDCYLLGMRTFNTDADHTFVFEDSFNGLKSGLSSGATVIGLATTNKAEDIAPFCHHILNNYMDFSFEKLIEVNERKHS
ncbi:MAG: HAD family hydrolase [Bacteroidaceae bacterium]|nr:HAD family hydrolase [Bacteroidaceae bacterium]